MEKPPGYILVSGAITGFVGVCILVAGVVGCTRTFDAHDRVGFVLSVAAILAGFTICMIGLATISWERERRETCRKHL